MMDQANTYSITDPQSGKAVTFKWKALEPPTAEEQAEILEVWRERQAPSTPAAPTPGAQGVAAPPGVKADYWAGLTPAEQADIARQGIDAPHVRKILTEEDALEPQPGQAAGFANRMIQNGAGALQTMTDLIPGGTMVRKLVTGEPVSWSDAVPGRAIGEAAAAKADDLAQRFTDDPSTVGKVGRAAAMVPDVLLGTPFTDMGDALGRGDVGSAAADALSMGLMAKGGQMLQGRIPGAPAAPPPSASAPVPTPPRPTWPAGKAFAPGPRPTWDFQMPEAPITPVVTHVTPKPLPKPPTSLDALGIPEVADRSWSIDRLDIPVERAVAQPEDLWQRALQNPGPTPAGPVPPPPLPTPSLPPVDGTQIGLNPRVADVMRRLHSLRALEQLQLQVPPVRSHQ